MQFKTIKDMWNKYKELSYGRDIDKFPVTQIKESEKIFYYAVGFALYHFRDDVTQLTEDEGVEHFESLSKEAIKFFDQAREDFDRMNNRFQ